LTSTHLSPFFEKFNLSKHVRKRKGRTRKEEHLQVLEGRSAVPRGAYRSLPQEGKVRDQGGRGRSRVPGRCARIPDRRGARARWQRRPRQQEGPDHPPPHSAGCPQRRGAQQAARRGDHRFRRRAPQHPRGFAPQEVQCRQGQGVGVCFAGLLILLPRPKVQRMLIHHGISPRAS
ncbi:unnamed protein product, partial [Ectocarpus fasciculatus]